MGAPPPMASDRQPVPSGWRRPDSVFDRVRGRVVTFDDAGVGGGDGWDCANCGYLSDERAGACEMCQHPRRCAGCGMCDVGREHLLQPWRGSGPPS